MLLCTVSHHPEATDRDKLLNMMFNLIKRPGTEQRFCTVTIRLQGVDYRSCFVMQANDFEWMRCFCQAQWANSSGRRVAATVLGAGSYQTFITRFVNKSYYYIHLYGR